MTGINEENPSRPLTPKEDAIATFWENAGAGADAYSQYLSDMMLVMSLDTLQKFVAQMESKHTGWRNCAGAANQLPNKPCAICGCMTHKK